MLKRQELKRLYNTSEFKEKYIDTERKQGLYVRRKGLPFSFGVLFLKKQSFAFIRKERVESHFFRQR